jgi:serine phosphatase RsbU (regulator of sigma subunit)
MEPGDRLLLLTDGLPEARDARGEPLGYQAFEELLAASGDGETPLSWLASLFDTVQQQTVRTPEDDWTAALLEPVRPETES